MARAERQVFGLDSGPARAVDLVDGLRHLVEVVEVFDGGTATPALEVRDERWSIHGSGDHVVAAERDRPHRVPRLECESGGGLGGHLHHEASVEAHPHPVDGHPGAAEDLAGAVVEEIDADLLQDGHRLLVDRLNVLARQDVVGLQAVLPHSNQVCITGLNHPLPSRPVLT